MPNEVDEHDYSHFITKIIRAIFSYMWIRAIANYASKFNFLLVVLSAIGAFISILFREIYIVYFSIFAPLSFLVLVKAVTITRNSLAKIKDLPTVANLDFKGGAKNKLEEFERILAAVFEVLIGLAIFEASLGILSFNFAQGEISISSPLHVFLRYPAMSLVYVVFIMTSAQYLMGGASHFRKGLPYSKNISFINFLLLIGQAITILGMSLSIVDTNIVMFAIWYIGLIVMDIIWLGTLVTPFHFISYEFSFFLRSIGTAFAPDTDKSPPEIIKADAENSSRKTIYGFWINGNFAYLTFLLVAEPLVYIKPAGQQYFETFIAFELFIMTLVSTFLANVKCLELLQEQ